MKAFLTTFGIGVLAIGSVILFFSHQSAPPPTVPLVVQTTSHPAPQTVTSLASSVPETPPATSSTPRAENPPPKPAQPENASTPPSQIPTPFTPPPQTGRGGKAPILDPDAREALSFVGADSDAEAYWFDAINNPSLPAEERQDLIEDLNEDGLSNPDHPGPGDLPLIENRLIILNELAYDSMDKVNADAIREATKDLAKMYADLTGN